MSGPERMGSAGLVGNQPQALSGFEAQPAFGLWGAGTLSASVPTSVNCGPQEEPPLQARA